MNKDLYVGHTTCASEEDALHLLDALLSKSLVACGQVSGPILSKYCWDGEIKSETEWRLTLKFKIDLKEELTQALHFHHKYETPEWIFQSAESSKGYLEWMNQSD